MEGIKILLNLPSTFTHRRQKNILKKFWDFNKILFPHHLLNTTQRVFITYLFYVKNLKLKIL